MNGDQGTRGSVGSLNPTSPEAYRQLLQRLADAARARAVLLGLNWSALVQDAPDAHSPARQALTLLEYGLFDEAWYTSTYTDVQAAGFDPLVHYVNLGDAEGRRPNPYFDPGFYRRQFGHTPPKSVCALYHYARVGESLGLAASGAFSPQRYLVANPELQPWVDKPLTHFLHLGRFGGLAANHRARLPVGEHVTFVQAAPSFPRPTGQLDPSLGINLIGPLDRVSGLGVSARGYLDGLRKAGFERIGCRAQQREFAIQKSIAGHSSFPAYLPDAKINLVHMNGDTLPVMIDSQGDDFLRGRYNIAVWYWELPTLRPEWQAAIKYFHEFWAPTPFIARILRQSTAKPVHLLPPYLAYLQGMQSTPPAAGSPAHFVYCFDANSILERKNPGALLQAFREAFGDSPDVRLSFKVTYPNRKVTEVDRLYLAAEDDARIEVIDRLLSDAELHALIGSATAYVSPHRSEGLGLTVIEAMAAGIPVIATPFGGMDAFVTEETAFPIDHGYVELAEDYPPYPKGYVWAEPQIRSLAERLREVRERKQDTHRRTGPAQHRVLEFFCAPQLPAAYRRRLENLG